MFNVGIIRVSGRPIGICLGFAASSSHEGGIQLIARDLGCSAYPKVRRDPVEAAMVTGDGNGRLFYHNYNSEVSYLGLWGEPMIARVMGKPFPREKFDRRLDLRTPLIEPSHYEDGLIHSAWGSGQFLIRMDGSSEFLRLLWEAFRHKTVAVFDQSDRRHPYSGLCIVNVGGGEWRRDYVRELIGV